MDFKKSITRLLICLIFSPVVFYLVKWAAQLAGSTYDITHGESFIIWLLMAILINLSLVDKK